MKRFISLATVAILIMSVNASPEYEKLRELTGASDEELRSIITLLLGSSDGKRLADLKTEVDSAKRRWAEKAVSSEEEAAMWTLLYLSQLEKEGPDVAAQYMAKRLDFFLNSKVNNERREKIRQNIKDYIATSKAFEKFYKSEAEEAKGG